MTKSCRTNRAVPIVLAIVCAPWLAELHAEEAKGSPCAGFRSGSAVPEPEDLRSVNGELTVDLTIRNAPESNGSIRYCYTTPDGREAPNLRASPGDLLILNLKNDLRDFGAAGHHHMDSDAMGKNDPCLSGMMARQAEPHGRKPRRGRRAVASAHRLDLGQLSRTDSHPPTISLV